MSHYVNVQYAADQLGCTVACLFRDAPKYRPFLRKSSDGFHNAGFNLDGFREAQELKEQLVERTKLLTEYLHHIENISYTDMAEICGVGKQSLWGCTYAFDSAYKIAKAIKTKKPYYWERFHNYYGWSYK